MPLRPEIRGLFMMASRAFEAHNYEAALQYFTLALRKYIRYRATRRPNILSDPLVLILTVNSSVVLCYMRNFSDAFLLLNAILLPSLEDPSRFLQAVPHQLVPLVLKIVSLAYLSNASDETKLLAIRYLQLIRLHYNTFVSHYLPADEASYVFLSESLLNSSAAPLESLDAFHSTFRLLNRDGNLKQLLANLELAPQISAVLLKVSAESTEHACSLTKDELDMAKRLMHPLDLICFLNTLGVAHTKVGRTLLAVEALEKSLRLLNSQVAPIVASCDPHRHVRTYLEVAISSNLSVAYHMLDGQNNAYRWNWESLTLQANGLMDSLFELEDGDDSAAHPLSWMVRYLSIFNRCAHFSLAEDFRVAQNGFSALFYKELWRLLANCSSAAETCGIGFIPDLSLELVEVLAMLMAANSQYDESWRMFLRCLDEVAKAAESLDSPAKKQNYLSTAYCRIMDKMDRCQPPSKIKHREFDEIRRFRLQAMTTQLNSRRSDAEERPAGQSRQASPDSRETVDDMQLVANEMRSILHSDEPPKRARKRKKHRSLVQKVFGALPNNRVRSSPYCSPDLRAHRPRQRQQQQASFSWSDVRARSASLRSSAPHK